MTRGWLELRLLMRSAEEYRRRGYSIAASGDDAGTDFFATRGRDVVVVQVKSLTYRPDIPPAPTDTHKPPSTVDLYWHPAAELIPRALVDEWLGEARRLADQYPDAAFMVAFRAIEACLRRIASTLPSLPTDTSQVGRMLAEIRDSGRIGEPDFERLTNAVRTRNMLAHGWSTISAQVPNDIDEVINICGRLNQTVESRAVDLLDAIAAEVSLSEVARLPELVALEAAKRTFPPEVVDAATTIAQGALCHLTKDPPVDPVIPQSSELWSDAPESLDLLSFDSVAQTVVGAVLGDSVSPLVIGLSGAWGSGKTTILSLVESTLRARDLTSDGQYLVLSTNPWRYDPSLAAQETLMGEVLQALQAKLRQNESDDLQGTPFTLANRLIGYVKHSIECKTNPTTTPAVQVPSTAGATSPFGNEDGRKVPTPPLARFQQEFIELLSARELAGVRRIVVLIDDLDRCAPVTILETLETIRRFLAVPKIAFIVAIDENQVAESIAPIIALASRSETYSKGQPGRLYLDKIFQVTVPIPRLTRFDTEAFLVLLQLGQRLVSAALRPYIEGCAKLRRNAGPIEELANLVEGSDISEEIAFASTLTPMLYDRAGGNPRRIKKFLNNLRMRQSIAERRGINLDAGAIAKLMMLENLPDRELETVADWLANGELPDKLVALEAAASHLARTVSRSNQAQSGESFGGELLRWAALSPSLAGVDLAPYLHFASSGQRGPKPPSDVWTQQRSTPADDRLMTQRDLSTPPEQT